MTSHSLTTPSSIVIGKTHSDAPVEKVLHRLDLCALVGVSPFNKEIYVLLMLGVKLSSLQIKAALTGLIPKKVYAVYPKK
jgi:hypothetical protein